jgi:DNA-binding MarR family transcriptional regulator
MARDISSDVADAERDRRDGGFGNDILVGFPARLNRIHGIILHDLDVPLTFRQYRTISRVASGYTSMSELAARANLTMAAVSEGVYALVKRGLLKAAPGVEDRRTVVLEATPAGVAAVKAGTEALERFWAFLLRDTETEERDALYSTLERLYWRATEFYDSGSSGSTLQR